MGNSALTPWPIRSQGGPTQQPIRGGKSPFPSANQGCFCQPINKELPMIDQSGGEGSSQAANHQQGWPGLFPPTNGERTHPGIPGREPIRRQGSLPGSQSAGRGGGQQPMGTHVDAGGGWVEFVPRELLAGVDPRLHRLRRAQVGLAERPLQPRLPAGERQGHPGTELNTPKSAPNPPNLHPGDATNTPKSPKSW